MKKTIESNRQIKAQERQQTAFKHRIKEWCVRMLILLFWILMGLYAVKELKDTFFYSTDNPPEREYEPYLRN